MRVLVVEDEPRIAADIKRGLERAGFVVECVGDGESAWFQADIETYDAVILDLGLPKLDGVSVLRKLRSAAASGLQERRTPIAPVVEQLVSALRRLPNAERLSWRMDVPSEAVYFGSEGDLLEMLGNLVDNARKWARHEVTIKALTLDRSGSITVDDDGPGMDRTEMAAIGRGQRWDEAVPGTGFGLAISRDLAVATGSRLSLSSSELGGLRAKIEWGSAEIKP